MAVNLAIESKPESAEPADSSIPWQEVRDTIGGRAKLIRVAERVGAGDSTAKEKIAELRNTIRVLANSKPVEREPLLENLRDTLEGFGIEITAENEYETAVPAPEMPKEEMPIREASEGFGFGRLTPQFETPVSVSAPSLETPPPVAEKDPKAQFLENMKTQLSGAHEAVPPSTESVPEPMDPTTLAPEPEPVAQTPVPTVEEEPAVLPEKVMAASGIPSLVETPNWNSFIVDTQEQPSEQIQKQTSPVSVTPAPEASVAPPVEPMPEAPPGTDPYREVPENFKPADQIPAVQQTIETVPTEDDQYRAEIPQSDLTMPTGVDLAPPATGETPPEEILSQTAEEAALTPEEIAEMDAILNQ
jgi:hypothetical protein